MKHESYWVYIVTSRSGTLYIGSTSNLMRRIWEHKNGILEGFTKQYGCTRLVYYEKHDDPRHSTNRERQLKGWTRARKVALIESVNPRWQDFAENWELPMALPSEPIAEIEARLSRITRLGLPNEESG